MSVIGNPVTLGGGGEPISGTWEKASDGFDLATLTRVSAANLDSAKDLYQGIGGVNFNGNAVFLYRTGSSVSPKGTITAYTNALTKSLNNVSDFNFVMDGEAAYNHYATIGNDYILSRLSVQPRVCNTSYTITQLATETELSGVSERSAGSFNNYGWLAGGYKSGVNNYGVGYVYCYDTSLTKTVLSQLSVARGNAISCKAGNGYILFGGGHGPSLSDYSSAVDGYDTNGTKVTTVASLATAREPLWGASCGDCGVIFLQKGFSSAVDVYSSSLTHTNPSIFPSDTYNPQCHDINGVCLIAGGYYSDYLINLHHLNTSFTLESLSATLSNGRISMVAAHTEDYVLFAGGANDDGECQTVDAFSGAPYIKLTPTDMSLFVNSSGSLTGRVKIS